jgi:hypothetical protein
MNEITSSRLNNKRPLWGEGEWNDEPDRIQWVDEITGMDCLIKRSPVGALCGYVAVTPDHPAYGKDYDDVEVIVHGGLTYAAPCDEDPHSGICHVSEEGDHAWWLGFDCAHSGDLAPSTKSILEELDHTFPTLGQSAVGLGGRVDEYRNIEYVRSQCVMLAVQLKGMA